MRFMLFMCPNTDEIGEDWGTPDVDSVAEMGRFNEQLVQAGVLLAADGFHPPTEGARVRRTAEGTVAADGPWDEPGPTLGGSWTIDVADKAEAVRWASTCPLGPGDMIEVRRIYEMSDFPEEVQAAAELSEVPPEQTSAA